MDCSKRGKDYLRHNTCIIQQRATTQGIYMSVSFAFFGHNHVNETARRGIIAHRLWEENLVSLYAISERNNFGVLFSLLG